MQQNILKLLKQEINEILEVRHKFVELKKLVKELSVKQ